MKNKLFKLSGLSFIVAVLLLILKVNINAQDHKGQEKHKKNDVIGKDNYRMFQ